MNQHYVVTNQHGHYYSKQKTWSDGRAPNRVYCPRYQDEALNTLLEINARDIELRGQVLAVELDGKGLPVLKISDIPVPEPEPAKLPNEIEETATPTASPSGSEVD